MNPADPITDHLADLEPLLCRWLPTQPWFGAADGPEGARPTDLALVAALPVCPPDDAGAAVTALLVRADGVTYHVPVRWVGDAEPPDEATDGVIGRLGAGTLLDATRDPAAARAMLRAIVDGSQLGAAAGTVRCGPEAQPVGPRPRPAVETLPPRALGARQRHTTVLFGDCCLVKVLRRVGGGPHPEVELLRALTGRGQGHAPALLGTMTAVPPGGVATLPWEVDGERPDQVVLAVLQELIPSGTLGWELATASVRDLYEEGDLFAGEVGGDFAAEAFRLGEATAAVHRDLADALGTSEADPSGTVDRLLGGLSEACGAVPELSAYEEAIRTRAAALRAGLGPVPHQRVHGDLSLTEVLRTDRGWVVIDFEGDPTLPVPERRHLRSPMVDVAGMLRSFEYAARHLLIGLTGDHRLTSRSRDWLARNAEAFVAGYRSIRPTTEAEAAYLRLLRLDRAVSDAVAEARYRPSWLSVPLGAIIDTAGSPHGR